MVLEVEYFPNIINTCIVQYMKSRKINYIPSTFKENFWSSVQWIRYFEIDEEYRTLYHLRVIHNRLFFTYVLI